MKKYIVFVCSLAFSALANGQLDQYVFERFENETCQAFTDRVLGEYKAEPEQTHPSIEGNWGDVSHGKKIMAFTGRGFTEYKRSAMVVFQPVGDVKNYIAFVYEGIGDIGTYYEGVINLFYMDVDDSGTKELVLIEKGGSREMVTFEEVDDDGTVVEFQSSACCVDQFNTIIIEQVQDQNDSFLPLLQEHDLSLSLDFSSCENAEDAKAVIRSSEE